MAKSIHLVVEDNFLDEVEAYMQSFHVRHRTQAIISLAAYGLRAVRAEGIHDQNKKD